MQRSGFGKHFALPALLSAIAGPALAEPQPVLDTPPPLDEAFFRAASVMQEAGLLGEIVLTDVAGPELSAAFGLADRAARTLNEVGQVWVWASVTKQVTATLVMQEVDRGRISLDAPINDFLPDFPGNQGITIRELLQHRSGLPNPSADEGSGFYAETGPTIMDTGRASVFCAGPARGPNG